MPGVAAHSERISAIRRERHLPFFGQRAVGKPLMENGTDMRHRAVGRQIELPAIWRSTRDHPETQRV